MPEDEDKQEGEEVPWEKEMMMSGEELKASMTEKRR